MIHFIYINQINFIPTINPIPSLPHTLSCTDWTSCQLLLFCPTLWSTCRPSLTLLTPWSGSGIEFWVLQKSSSSPWSRKSLLRSFCPRILSEFCPQGAVRFPPKAHTLWHVSFRPRKNIWSANRSVFLFTFPWWWAWCLHKWQRYRHRPFQRSCW